MTDKEYEVEALLDKRSLPGEEVRYLIKWKGWDHPEDNTWERLSKLSGCKKLLRAFEAKLSKEKQRKERLSKEKHGFGQGLTPEKVIGATKISGELTLQVKWKESDRADLVPAKEANEKIPQVWSFANFPALN